MALHRRDVLRLLAAAPLLARARPAEAAPAVVIGHITSLTGMGATFGISAQRAVDLALHEANEAGGIAGRPIRVVTLDDRSEPEEAVAAAAELLTQPDILAALGPVSSSASLGCGVLFEAARVPMIVSTATYPKVTQLGGNIVRTCFVDPFQGTALAAYLRHRGLARAAVLHDPTSDYSAGIVATFTEGFVTRGGAILATSSYEGHPFDFLPQLRAVLPAEPDVLVVPGYYTEAGLVARQARELGYTGLFAGGDGWDSDKLWQIGQAAIEGGVYVNHWAVDDPDPTSRAFVDRFGTRHGADPDTVAALAYDAAGILVLALRQAAQHAPAILRKRGPAERAAFRALVRQRLAATTGYPGLTGPITLGPDRDARRAAVIVEVTAEGPRFLTRVSP